MSNNPKKEKLSKREQKYLEKKSKLFLSTFPKICNNKRLSFNAYGKILKKFVKKCVKYDLNQSNIHKIVLFDKIKNTKDAPNGLTASRGSFLSYVGINYARTINDLKKAKTPEDKAVILTTFSQTIFHESEHIKQREVARKASKLKDIAPEYAYKYGIEFACKDFLKQDYYKKEDNYKNMLHERDARIAGFAKTSDVLVMLNNRKEVRDFYDKDRIKSILEDTFRESNMLTDVNGNLVDRQEYNNQVLAAAIKENPKIIKKYKVLQKAFNKDGSRKLPYQTVKDYLKSAFTIKANPFLNSTVKKDKLTDLQNLYGEIYTETLNHYCDEKEYILSCKMVGKDSMMQMIRIAKKHAKNYEKDLVESAEFDYEIKERFDGSNPKNSRIKYMKLQYVNDISEQNQKALNEYLEYTRSLKTKEFSNIEKLKQDKIQHLAVKSRAKSQKIKGRSKAVYMPKAGYDKETEEHINSSDSIITSEQLQEMIDLRDNYKNLESKNLENLEEAKSQYYSLLDKSKEEMKNKNDKSK